MATHEQNIKNLQNAIKGEDVRGSMIELFEEDYTYSTKFIMVGNDVTSEDSSTEGYYADMLYFNETTNDLWKCTGDAWSLVGNLKGAKGDKGDTGDKGDKGDTGDKGDKGDTGDAGDRGNDWFTGTALEGKNTGISGAEGIVGDLYLNTVSNNVYKCTISGTDVTAKWDYITNIKGSQGPGSGDMESSKYAENALSEGLNSVVDSALTLYGLTLSINDLNKLNSSDFTKSKEYSSVLTSGSETISLGDGEISDDSDILVFTDTYGVSPTNVVLTNGTCVLTFKPLSKNITVKIVILYKEKVV